jgi:hypothetical protein
LEKPWHLLTGRHNAPTVQLKLGASGVLHIAKASGPGSTYTGPLRILVWDKLKMPKLIIEISRGLGAEAKLFRAHNFQVADNSTLVITDAHGQAHYIPMRMWERIEIRRVPSAAHADESAPA